MLGSVKVYSGWMRGGVDAREMHGSASRMADRCSFFAAHESIKFISSSALDARETMLEYRKLMVLLSLFGLW